MKRAVAALVLMAVLTVTLATGYQSASRDRQYQAFLRRGDSALADGQASGATEAYSGAIALHADSMLAHLRRGEAYRLRGELDDAARDFRKAAALDPAAPRPLEQLGDVLYVRGRFDRAAEAYQQRLQLDERSADVTYKLALARYRAGDMDQALAAIAATLRLSAPSSNIEYASGLCLREKHQYREAIQAFERAVALDPAATPPREELAELFELQGRTAEEVEQLQVLAGLDSGHVERQLAIGLAQARTGQWDLAVTTLGGALERSPDEPLVFAALGGVWLEIAEQRQDRRDALGKALEALGRVATTSAATSEVLTRYGRALVRSGQMEAADRVLERATLLYPVDPAAFREYAFVAEHFRRLPAARTALLQYNALAPEDDPSAPRRAYQIAVWSLRLHDAKTALGWLKRAARGDAADAGFMLDVADAQTRTGDRAGAETTIRRSLDRNPDNQRLQNAARALGVAVTTVP